MTVQRKVCFEVRCDGCGDGHGDRGVPHWDSVEEAKTALSGESWGPWRITAEAWLCDDCALAADCAANGHQRVESYEHRGHHLCDHCGCHYPVEWVEQLMAGITALPTCDYDPNVLPPMHQPWCGTEPDQAAALLFALERIADRAKLAWFPPIGEIADACHKTISSQAAEIERLRAELEQARNTSAVFAAAAGYDLGVEETRTELERVTAERDAASGVLMRVRMLHHEDAAGLCAGCDDMEAADPSWPCPTGRVLATSADQAEPFTDLIDRYMSTVSSPELEPPTSGETPNA